MIWWIAGYLTLAAGFYAYAALTAEPDPYEDEAPARPQESETAQAPHGSPVPSI